MTKYICITSGKGGVGKTTTAVNLASSMHARGEDVILVDGNLSTPHVNLHLGSKETERSMHDAIQEKVHVAELIYTHGSGLRTIPTNTTIEHLKYPDYEGLKYAIRDLEDFADYVVIDGAPGFGREALAPMELADEIIIVATPDHASIEVQKTVRIINFKVAALCLS